LSECNTLPLPEELAVKIWKDILGGLVGVALLAIGIYGLFLYGGGGMNRGEGGGLASDSIRNIVILSVFGVSAFITGFGFRDVVGRAAAARQRKRLATAREVKKP
jgi:hypothetical protein